MGVGEAGCLGVTPFDRMVPFNSPLGCPRLSMDFEIMLGKDFKDYVHFEKCEEAFKVLRACV